MPETNSLQTRIREFIVRQFPRADKEGLNDTDSLVESGLIDSMGVLDIVMFLESEFGLVLEDDEVASDNFESIAQLASFVENKLACQQGTSP